MVSLLILPNLSDSAQPVQQITAASANWQYVGFEVHDLVASDQVSEDGDDQELCLVLLSGSVRFQAGDIDSGVIIGRESVFEGVPPTALYVPMQTGWKVSAHKESEVAICRSPGVTGKYPARLITPDEMSLEVRGIGTNTRHVCNILPDTEPADSLLVVEVVTPAGNWSSYPPHKHDTYNLPKESYLEETYYHRINPPQGYVMHRVYTDDRSLDSSMAAGDRSVVLVPRGYHPVGAPHGYESYYLNVMAGPKRIWKFRNDPAHDWIVTG